MVLIGCAGFASNYFSGRAFVNRSDITSAIGSFVVGMLGGIYAKYTRGSAFVVMVCRENPVISSVLNPIDSVWSRI